jgi:DNA polymerase, archaea type
VMNSIYGCLGAAVGRMSFPEGAAAITYVGRTYIGKVREYLVKEGCKIIYGDTDSLMFQVPQYDDTEPLLGSPIDEQAVELGHRMVGTINETLPAPMAMEFEKVLNAVFVDKKRYTGFVTWPERKMFVTGAAAVRGDTTPFARRLYTTILSAVLQDKTNQEVKEMLESEVLALRNKQIPNNMLSVSKMLAHSYVSPSAPMNVYAKYLISIGELAEAGTKIPLIVTKQPRAGPRALSYRLPTTTEEIDYEYYEEMAKRPLTKLMEAAYMIAGTQDTEEEED